MLCPEAVRDKVVLPYFQNSRRNTMTRRLDDSSHATHSGPSSLQSQVLMGSWLCLHLPPVSALASRLRCRCALRQTLAGFAPRMHVT